MKKNNVNEMYDIHDSKELCDKLLELDEKIKCIPINDLTAYKTPILIEEIKDYLYLYKEKVPKEFKKEFKKKLGFDYENFKDKIKKIENYIEISNKENKL